MVVFIVRVHRLRERLAVENNNFYLVDASFGFSESVKSLKTLFVWGPFFEKIGRAVPSEAKCLISV